MKPSLITPQDVKENPHLYLTGLNRFVCLDFDDIIIGATFVKIFASESSSTKFVKVVLDDELVLTYGETDYSLEWTIYFCLEKEHWEIVYTKELIELSEKERLMFFEHGYTETIIEEDTIQFSKIIQIYGHPTDS